MARQPTDAPLSSREWILIGVIEQSVMMLAEDICRIYLERGHRTDVLWLAARGRITPS
jgi:hypothetical protein